MYPRTVPYHLSSSVTCICEEAVHFIVIGEAKCVLNGSVSGVVLLDRVFGLEFEHGVIVSIDPEVILLQRTIEGVDEAESIMVHREVSVVVFVCGVKLLLPVL